MGVPFEALIPYAIMLGVRLTFEAVQPASTVVTNSMIRCSASQEPGSHRFDICRMGESGLGIQSINGTGRVRALCSLVLCSGMC